MFAVYARAVKGNPQSEDGKSRTWVVPAPRVPLPREILVSIARQGEIGQYVSGTVFNFDQRGKEAKRQRGKDRIEVLASFRTEPSDTLSIRATFAIYNCFI